MWNRARGRVVGSDTDRTWRAVPLRLRTLVFLASITALAGLVLLPSPAYAYMGPGAGLSAIGALLSLVAAGVVSILGFIWFPIKRAIRMLRSKQKRPRQSSLLFQARRMR